MGADHSAAPTEIREVAVVGLGTMGAGIAEVLTRSVLGLGVGHHL